MITCYLGIGSNVGEREKNIKNAIEKLQNTEGITVTKVSALIETDPVGGPPQGKFLNGALEIETQLNPRQLLNEIKKIERELGRKKTVKNGPRSIDVDILFYGNEVVDEEELQIPHPRMKERAFVLEPLREIIDERAFTLDEKQK